MSTHDRPTYLHRPRLRRWTVKQRLAFAVKSSEHQNAPAKVTLSTPPWEQEEKDGRKGMQTLTSR